MKFLILNQITAGFRQFFDKIPVHVKSLMFFAISVALFTASGIILLIGALIAKQLFGMI